MDNFSSVTTQSYLPYTISEEQEFISTFLLEKIYKILITVIGLFGNGVTIIILTNKRNRKSSTAIFLTALAVSDILILVFGPLCDWIEVMWKVIIKEYGSFTCKLQTYMHYSSSSTSSWLLAAVTIQKAISVTFPYRVRSSCNTRVTFIVIISTWIILYGVNMHFLFGMGHTYNKACGWVSVQYMNFAIYILPWIDFCLCFAIPFIIMSIGNIIIVRQLAVTRSRRKFLTNGNAKLAKNLSVSLILVTVSIVFIVTVGPIYILSILDPYLRASLTPQQMVSVKRFWGPLLNGLWEMNAAVNMVLYILSGTKFRQEVKYLLCCKKPKKETGVFDNSVLLNKCYMLSSRRRMFLEQKNSKSSLEQNDFDFTSSPPVVLH